MRIGESIPLSSDNDSLCIRDCNGACCHGSMTLGMMLELDDNEYAFLQENGAKMVPAGRKTRAQLEAEAREYLGDLASVVGIVTMGPDNPEYVFIEDCPFLDKSKGVPSLCTIYEDPRRPAICDGVKIGDPGCVVARTAFYDRKHS